MKGYRKLISLFSSLISIIVLAIFNAPAEAFVAVGVCTSLYYVAVGGKQFAEAWKMVK